MRWSAPVWGEDRRAPHHGRAWPWSGPVMTPGGHTRLLPSVPGIRGSLAVRTRLQHTDSTQIALTLRVLRTALPAELIVVPPHLQARHCRPAALLWRQQQQAPCVHAVQQCKEGLCLASALHGDVHCGVAAGLPTPQACPARMCRRTTGAKLLSRSVSIAIQALLGAPCLQPPAVAAGNASGNGERRHLKTDECCDRMKHDACISRTTRGWAQAAGGPGKWCAAAAAAC